jgi:hypothetical protein
MLRPFNFTLTVGLLSREKKREKRFEKRRTKKD